MEDGPSATLALHGIGKFPHIRLDLDSISFGELYTGHQAARRLSLANPSLVPANFQVRMPRPLQPGPLARKSMAWKKITRGGSQGGLGRVLLAGSRVEALLGGDG